MEKLLEGYRRFHTHVFPKRRSLFRKLAGGQDPHCLLITCSDSRIEPYLITDLDPGQLFVLRNAGNVVPPDGGELATVEYAVSALAVRDVVVCGHSGCGAVTAALRPETAASMPAVKEWVERMGIPPASSEEEVSQRLDEAIRDNVRRQLATLRGLPFIQQARDQGRLDLHGWVYDIATGTISACDADGGAFRPLLEDVAA